MDDPAAALAQLKTSLDGLEGALAPILSQPWNETLEGTTSVERAKMDVLLAYSINNLVWSESIEEGWAGEGEWESESGEGEVCGHCCGA